VIESDWQFDPPADVLQSRLFAAGGYLVVSGLFDEDTLRGLLVEAQGARAEAARVLVAESDGTEGRGGYPARAYRSGAGGKLHWDLHQCAQMAETVSRVCGLPVSVSGRGTYSYYEQTGDFLALHRDVLQCDIASITALTSCSMESSAGELVVYPHLVRDPLSTVRTAGRDAGRSVPLDRGQTIFLLGGLVPHEVAPTRDGQERIVAINCFHAANAGGVEPGSGSPHASESSSSPPNHTL
jgi:hypothetical protein